MVQTTTRIENSANDSSASMASMRSHVDAKEWALRVKLAACYRIFDHLGWIELIFNHITLRVPGPEHHFLINPFGLMYNEVTASSLVKIDLQGNILHDTPYDVNPAGFVIHSAIHEARDDAHCVMHTHTTTGSAVSCKEQGLENTNFYTSIIGDDLAYHSFEGTTTNDDEKARLVESLGQHNRLILRNHGLLSCGNTVENAFSALWTLQRACDVQAMSQSIGGADLVVSQEAVKQSRQATGFETKDGRDTCQLVFDALLRIVDQKDATYKL